MLLESPSPTHVPATLPVGETHPPQSCAGVGVRGAGREVEAGPSLWAWVWVTLVM